MLGTIANRQLLSPGSLRDALRMLDAEGPLVPMAGCTDLYVALNFGTLHGTKFLNLWGLDELRRIAVRDDVLSIGALCTYTGIIRSGIVQTWVPMLVAAAREVGGVQIQNRGTIGGNIANASPAGDTLPVLAAADAVVAVKSAAGERRIRLADFYTGYRTSSIGAISSRSTRWASSMDAPEASAASVLGNRTTVGATLPIAMRGARRCPPGPRPPSTAAMTTFEID